MDFKDYINPADVAFLLPQLFKERVRRSGSSTALKYWHRASSSWQDITWLELEDRIQHLHNLLKQESLNIGDRVGIMLRNCPEWLTFEQAALRLGLVVVPFYTNDRAENIAHIINESGVKLLLLEGAEQYDCLCSARDQIEQVPKLISLSRINCQPEKLAAIEFSQWLSQSNERTDEMLCDDGDTLASIVYTSGTTGMPKGVMLSHRNILFDAYAGINSVTVLSTDLFLSFLPLSHTLERTVGSYIPIMTGAGIAYCRSIPQLAEDLENVKPTVMVSVPRIFERVYGRIHTQMEQKSFIAQSLFRMAVNIGWQRFLIEQGRGNWSPGQLFWPVLKKLVAQKIVDKLGGRLRFTICGGAPLQPEIAQTFIGLGIPILQGYGLTESSPVISVNHMENNIPASIGPALEGIEVRIGENQELQTRSPAVMLGYWHRDDATRETFTNDGWLKTGDQARIDGKHIFITGRIKEILVLSNGEKVPPADIEMAICLDPLFEQVLVIGENKPYLSAVIVLNEDHWRDYARSKGFNADDPAQLHKPAVIDMAMSKINKCMCSFPGYAQVRRISLTLDAWTDVNGLLTASLKLRRKPIMEKHADEIEAMYKGH